jgi:hypothetical protein
MVSLLHLHTGQGDKVTAKDVGTGVTLLIVTPWAAGFERNTGFHRFTFTPSLEPFGIERYLQYETA